MLLFALCSSAILLSIDSSTIVILILGFVKKNRFNCTNYMFACIYLGDQVEGTLCSKG